ncbi:MAG: hypothetical protein LBK63_09915 [Treponema sp.]|nr:hypothetical protein [Treponema sp.]
MPAKEFAINQGFSCKMWNNGFSTAEPERLYLPVDTNPGSPNVEDQAQNSDSLLNRVKAIFALRHAEPDLQARPNFAVVYQAPRFPAYKRPKLFIP